MADTLLSVTPAARAQLLDLLAEDDTQALRVFVYPGGCSGMSYGMALDTEIDPTDQVIVQDGMRLVVDDNSVSYLQGAQIDYEASLMGGGFRIFNPNAVRSCGCGHSFDTGAESDLARACSGCG